MKLEWKPEDGIEDLMLKALMATLWECEGNKCVAAEKLKVCERTIRNWIEKFGLDEYRNTMPPAHTRRKITKRAGRKPFLDAKTIEAIRHAYIGRGGPTFDDLAKRFGVSATTVRNAVRGKRL